MISLFLFFILFWGWSVGVVRGPVRIGSLWTQSVVGVRGLGVSVFGPKLRLGLLAYFVSNVRHMQWPISQIYNEGSIFI